MSTIVVKFGGASIKSPAGFRRIAEIIAGKKQVFNQVLVVLSAMGSTTSNLLLLAKKIHPNPPKREADMLLSAGERISAALLAMALKRNGLDAMSFTGSQAGIITCSRHTDARIIDVKPYRLLPPLREGKIVIVAGFQGTTLDDRITTLGRGGSDTTAVAIAGALGALQVDFYKDVPGIFSQDPKKDPTATHYKQLTYREAKLIVQKGAQILHDRCLDLAETMQMPLRVLSYEPAPSKGELSTWIRGEEDSISAPGFEKLSGDRKEGLASV
ncbi:MAG: aspartate kinase [Chlamydiota bacterium]